MAQNGAGLPIALVCLTLLLACNDADGEASAVTDAQAAEAAMVAVRAVSAGFTSATLNKPPTEEALEQQRRDLEADRIVDTESATNGDGPPASIEIDGASSTFHLSLDGYSVQDALGESAGPYTRASGSASMAPGAVFAVDLQLAGGPVRAISFVLDPEQFAASGSVLEAQVNGIARTFEVDPRVFTGPR